MKFHTARIFAALLCLPLPLYAAGSEAAASAPALKFPIEIRTADESVRMLLQEYLPMITQQQEEELDAEQMEFLAEEAPGQVRDMLRTRGYFNAEIDIRRNGSGWTVDVKPGVQSKVGNVSMAITGDILQDEDLGLYYRQAMENWTLPVGEVFTQDNWSSSKTAVLAAVKRKKYPLAVFSHTEATVDPAKNSADLAVNVDSRQPVYFGPIHVEGSERYPESVVRGLAQFGEGSPYDLDQLLDYQQALEQDSHYSGASVQADFDNLAGDRVPVKVTVAEVKRHKVEIGLRYDSADGPGGRFAYDYYNLFGKGYVGSAVIDGDANQTTVAVGISQPRNNRGHYWTGNVSYNRSLTQKLEKRAFSNGIWYVRDRGGIESRIGLEYISENARLPDTNTDLGHSYATMLTASWKRQNISTPMHPKNGYYLDGKIGTTFGKLLSSSSMQRISASAGYYFTPENEKIGTFVLRGKIGYVYTGDADNVPTSLMFRTGGASSVRGYELDSIGQTVTDFGAVLPGRALAVGSAEYQYPISKTFSAAVFHDVGGVAANFKDMKLMQGTGVGVRWFSPMAPFSFDIAYGHHDKKIRWHISLGTRF